MAFQEQQPGDACSHIEALKNHVFSEPSLTKLESEMASGNKPDAYVVFLSLCNARVRATVVKGIGRDLGSAWKEADKNAGKIISTSNLDIVWAKADIVTSAKEIPTTDINKEMTAFRMSSFYLRKGISLDPGFGMAFLEGEMNGSRLYRYFSKEEIANNKINYDSMRINRSNIKDYLKTYYPKAKLPSSIPEVVTIFTTCGFFCGEDAVVHELYGGADLEAGRRIVDEVDANMAHEVMMSASRYLFGMIKPGGRFVYGYHPIAGREIDNYNILRHAGSIWSLINLYRVTQDKAIIASIDSAIEYLLSNFVTYKEPDTAYIFEAKTKEIKLGGNGLTVIMLTEYMTVFETDKYMDVIGHLANGILKLQDPESGKFYHVLNYPDFSRKEEFRTIYYDGEAAFALIRAYTFTKEDRYLRAAALAVDNFIAGNYVQYRDHWVAYALNEIVMYLPELRYYEFALRNASENFNRISRLPTTHPTCLELLMGAWQTYERFAASGVKLDYAKKFNVQLFAETIYKQAFHLLNAFCYPEYAMYFKYPDKCVGSVFIRHDRFRIRIDDMQHFISGFYLYELHYSDIRKHLSEEFVRGVGLKERKA